MYNLQSYMSTSMSSKYPTRKRDETHLPVIENSAGDEEQFVWRDEAHDGRHGDANRRADKKARHWRNFPYFIQNVGHYDTE